MLESNLETVRHAETAPETASEGVEGGDLLVASEELSFMNLWRFFLIAESSVACKPWPPRIRIMVFVVLSQYCGSKAVPVSKLTLMCITSKVGFKFEARVKIRRISSIGNVYNS